MDGHGHEEEYGLRAKSGRPAERGPHEGYLHEVLSPEQVATEGISAAEIHAGPRPTGLPLTGDEQFAIALIDHLTYHAPVITIEGWSYCMCKRRNRQEETRAAGDSCGAGAARGHLRYDFVGALSEMGRTSRSSCTYCVPAKWPVAVALTLKLNGGVGRRDTSEQSLARARTTDKAVWR